MRLCSFLLILLFGIACIRQPEKTVENNDYVLVEFAAKLEEDQEQFQKLEEKSSIVP